jgi:hypothetical protein
MEKKKSITEKKTENFEEKKKKRKYKTHSLWKNN